MAHIVLRRCISLLFYEYHFSHIWKWRCSTVEQSEER